MDIDDCVALGLIGLTLTLAAFGVGHLFGDYRKFSALAQECRETGYLQDKVTRVYCHVDAPPTKGK